MLPVFSMTDFSAGDSFAATTNFSQAIWTRVAGAINLKKNG
jgi:hypothetical protein